jgi:predicted  nucleic acid-binding Zn-ribbon protein
MIKTILKTTSIALLIATSTFTSCQSNTAKTEAADQKVQDAKKELDDAKMKADAAQKTANAEEWNAFKADIEVKIQNNESEITALKAKMKSSKKKMDAAYVKSVDDLEMKNKALKEKINAYSNDTKSDWASFKREFNHDMDELGSALKDLTVNNKN